MLENVSGLISVGLSNSNVCVGLFFFSSCFGFERVIVGAFSKSRDEDFLSVTLYLLLMK